MEAKFLYKVKQLVKRVLEKYIPGMSVYLLRRRVKRDSAFLLAEEEVLFQGKANSEIFSEIYSQNIWGGGFARKTQDFFSGPGSYGMHAREYITCVRDFIVRHQVKSITDIGCGDFHIGNMLLKDLSLRYTGVDVVKELVDHNNKHFASDQVNFMHRDATRERVVVSDLLLIREVLQHLSNSDIGQLIEMNFTQSFKYILVTEHQVDPTYLIKPNMEKLTGNYARADFGSGVYLDQPPFHLAWELLLKLKSDHDPPSSINTYRITQARPTRHK